MENGPYNDVHSFVKFRYTRITTKISKGLSDWSFLLMTLDVQSASELAISIQGEKVTHFQGIQ